MMDQERTEKELQEVFQEIQRSYKALVDDAFALQERTLNLARGLLENSAQARSRGTQEDALEALAEESRTQREGLEKLLRKSNEAFVKVLRSPHDLHHKVEEAKADLQTP